MQNFKEKLVEQFQDFEKSLNGFKQSPIHQIRKSALEIFKTNGFPSTKDEEWKYLSLRPILKQNPGKTSEINLSESALKNCLIPNLEVNQVVLVDGIFVPEFSKIVSTETGLVVESFKTTLQNQASKIEQYFAQLADFKNNSLTALSTAFAQEGVFIEIPAHQKIEIPIHIIHVSTGDFMAQSRNLILAQKNSSASIIESFHSIQTAKGFQNTVTEIDCQANSHLDFYKLQTDFGESKSIGTIQCQQAQDSTFSNYTISWSGALVRNNLNTIHKGKNCLTNYFGLYLTDEKQIIDNHTLVDHAMPNCESNEVYKGIAKDFSKAIFNGKIMVRQDAQKTNAYQSNKNILLDDSATINAKPQLEIFADDVKCSHGATVGQLDENELFYLQARGINKKTALQMLLIAFAGDVLENIKNEAIRNYLYQGLNEKLIG